MSDITPPPATETPAPATIPLGQAPSLRAYEEARAKGQSEIANPAAADAPDDEVAGDPELASEIDKVEAPKAEETPQERNARHRRAKKAAAKARVTRLSNERDAANGKLTEAEKELAEWREGKRSPQARTETPAEPKTASRPRPSLKDFPLEKFKDDDDPYQSQGAALAEAVADWRIEQHEHGLAQQRQRETAAAEARELGHALDQSEADAKARYADYDAIVGAARFPATPASEYVRESIARSGVFGPLCYHLCKHPETMRAILNAQTRRDVDWALGAEIATVKTALAHKAEPPKVTSATEPLQPVTAVAGTGAIHKSPKDMTLSEFEAYRASGGGRR